MIAAYILQSLKDFSYYIGSTSDLEKRLKQHNNGHSRYTKNKCPWQIVYYEKYTSVAEAKKREYYLKSLKSRVAIEKLIKTVKGPIV